MEKIFLVSEKEWHYDLFKNLQNRFSDYHWMLINTQKEFSATAVQFENPHKIFIPHWSYIISSEIFNNYECILFHMTDLPFGRGGSPLQNLIVRGLEETKISALRVEKGLDTGPIYLKKNLNLLGTAQEIFLRSNKVIEEMISEILQDNISPTPQVGEVVEFRRRKPIDGDIFHLKDLNQIYDFIRMLDCEGYPPAFLENKNFRFEFTRPSLISNKEIAADVRIIKK